MAAAAVSSGTKVSSLPEVDHRLVVFQHGQALRARARIGAQRDGFFHQAFGGVRVGAALVAFGLIDRAREVGDHVVIQRLRIILDVSDVTES